MSEYQEIYNAIVSDPRYQCNLDWGESRPGHPEGSVRAHIAEVERNLEALLPKLSVTDYWKLKILIHTHDSFKREARQGVAITAPESHASLACAFLRSLCDDADLLAMVQYHDEPFALWRQFEAKGKFNEGRLSDLLNRIRDWNLFLAFNKAVSRWRGCSGRSRDGCSRNLRRRIFSNFAYDDPDLGTREIGPRDGETLSLRSRGVIEERALRDRKKPMQPRRRGAPLTTAMLAGALVALAGPLAAQAQDASDIAEGGRLFRQKGNCQACHGWAGDGRKLDSQMPDGANLRETRLDRAAVVMTIKCGIPGAGMPPFDKFAYSDGRCYGLKKADLAKAGQTLSDPPDTLQVREIDALVDFLYAKVIGKGPMNHAKCVEYWGSEAEPCKDFPN